MYVKNPREASAFACTTLEDSRIIRSAKVCGNTEMPDAIKKLSYTHDALIDLIIAHPELSQGALAAQFGYTQSWICQVIASDAFQSALAKRKDELIDPILKNTVEENFRGMVRRSHEILMEKLNRPTAQIPDNLALRTYELGMRGAGYGAKSPEPRVQVNVVGHLEALGPRLEELLRRKRNEAAGYAGQSGTAGQSEEDENVIESPRDT